MENLTHPLIQVAFSVGIPGVSRHELAGPSGSLGLPRLMESSISPSISSVRCSTLPHRRSAAPQRSLFVPAQGLCDDLGWYGLRCRRHRLGGSPGIQVFGFSSRPGESFSYKTVHIRHSDTRHPHSASLVPSPPTSIVPAKERKTQSEVLTIGIGTLTPYENP